ncbi:MAG: S9 family peptidase [Myxococcales bacterium FL481]|nr:MAG: S9 family peptidase [Myxococcales bacterium FL481]
MLNRSFRSLLILTTLTLAAGCSSAQEEVTAPPVAVASPPPAPTPAPVDRSDPNLIPRDVLFGNPERAAPSISPDGQQILFLAPLDGVLNVWISPTNDVTAAKPITADKKRGIRFATWAWSGKYVLYIQDKDGDENWHLYRVDPTSGVTKDLTPYDGATAWFIADEPEIPDEVMVTINDRDPKHHDLYRLHLETGERTLVRQNNEGLAQFIVDRKYKLRYAMKQRPEGGRDVLAPTGKDGWRTVFTIPHEDDMSTSIRGFDRAGRTAYLVDSRGRETSALVAVDARTGKEKTILAQDPKVDVGRVRISHVDQTVRAVSFNYLRQRWEFLDERAKADAEYLATVSPGESFVSSADAKDEVWIVGYEQDAGPVRYYRYDRKAKQATFLFANKPKLEQQPLVPMHPRVIKSRDGLELVSYLTLPVASDPDRDGRPNAAVPMVLFVHGGPWARDSWGYQPYHQWLANRGYAVLSVNFRGSTGFTKAFLNAGDREWAGKMHDDLIDAVNWAVTEQIAQPDKVAIMGGSYGGYATLVGLTFTPDTFACGVDIVGPSNLVTLIETIPPYWQPMIETFAKRMGDHRTPQGRQRLQERSPLTHVANIKKPLLIGQGANDPRVKQAESDQIVAAMQQRGIPVTYVLYPDEGHGFARPENRKSFNAVTEAFLSECLEGKYQPIGGDFSGSSITVPAGAEFVPGLADALASTATPTPTPSPDAPAQ